MFEVPDGHRMRIIQDGSGLLVACTLLSGSRTTCENHTTIFFLEVHKTIDYCAENLNSVCILIAYVMHLI
jgi:hypothetical protein